LWEQGIRHTLPAGKDYLKAVSLLTINADKLILQKQVEELTEKTKDNEYTISSSGLIS